MEFSSSYQRQTSLQLLLLRLLLLCTVFSLSTANSRYNRLNVLQNSLNQQQPILNDQHVVVFPLESEENEAKNNYYATGEEGRYTLTSNNFKREGVRRCGMILIKHIQKVCNGCVGRPRSSEESARSKRSFDPFVETESLTDLCCKKTCDDAQLQDFCCV